MLMVIIGAGASYDSSVDKCSPGVVRSRLMRAVSRGRYLGG